MDPVRFGLTSAMAAVCLAFVPACGSSPELVSAGVAPIIKGEPSPESENAAVAVVLTSGGGLAGSCSGVIIAPTIVLTARHCVSETEPGGLACTKEGKSLGGGGVLKDHAANDLAILVGPKASFSFSARGKKIIHDGAKNLCNHDLALILLDKPITGTPIATIRLDTAPVKGDLLTAVGWGTSDSPGIARRHRTGIPVTVVGPGNSPRGGGVGPAEFAIGEGICSGDSGGPAFDEKTGAVIGVVSRGGNGNPDTSSAVNGCIDTAEYKTSNFYTRTDGYKDLILAAFAEAGEKVWLEGEPDPRKAGFGLTCAAPEDCQSNWCLGAGGKNFCSQVCADDKPCPDGYTCSDVGGTKLCVPTPPPPAPAPPTASSGGCSASGATPISTGVGFGALLGLAALVRVGRRRR
ncbi:MAG: S1 family peptidase [Myxococcales bacterium]|nr:S1 family peptidase [Myxococcales bacterium]